MDHTRNWLGAIVALVVLSPGGSGAFAQAGNYPNRPVTIISDAPPGSTPDVDARFVADSLGSAMGQQFVVINHAGAYGSLAARQAGDAAPDGYTLFMPSLASFIAPPGAASNVPLMLPRDFLPIGFTAENPMFVAVNPALGVSTLPDLIALAKKQPGTISIAVTGVGRLTHLSGLVLQERAGIQLLPVPYNSGPAAAVADVASGRVSMIVEGYSGIVGAVKAGQIKLIAVGSRERLPQFPDLPTVSETIPNFRATGWQVLVAQLGTPKDIVDKLAVNLARGMDDPDFKRKLANVGSYSRAMMPDQVLAFVDEEQKTWLPEVEKIPSR